MNHDQHVRHDNQVNEGISKLDPSFMPTPLSDVELIMKKAHEICLAVRAITVELDRQHHAAGTPHDIKSLATIISRKFAEGFSCLDKDELIFLLTAIHTDIAVDAMTGNTTTPKLIKPI